jgi:hypothetical protein
MQRPNVGTRPYTYGSDEFLSNKAAIVSPGPDGMLGTHDDTATPGHEYTPEMLARYYAKARKLYITSTGGVPQGGQETFSSVGVMYEVGQDSPLTQQSGLLGASDVERAVQSGAGLTVEAMSTSNRWTFNDQTKQAVGEDSGIVFESGKVYRGDNATAILATDPNWQPLSYDQITAPNITTVVVDTLESQMAHALFDLNYLSENTLPPHLTIVPPTLPTPASEIQVAPAAPYYPK